MIIYRWKEAIEVSFKRATRLLARPSYSMAPVDPPRTPDKPIPPVGQSMTSVATSVAQAEIAAALPTAVQQAVADWMAVPANRASLKGDPGLDASNAQVATAVSAWMAVSANRAAVRGNSVNVIQQEKLIATPTVALLSTSDVTFTWDTPFPDDQYLTDIELRGGAIGNLRYVQKSKTATAYVITVTALIAINGSTGQIRAQATRVVPAS